MAFVSLFTVVAINSCSKDENTSTSSSSAFDGKLSGTIKTESGAALNGEVDTLKLYDGNVVKSFPVSADGSFEFTLPTPSADKLDLLSEGMPDGLSITPADAKFYSVNEIEASKNGSYVGYVYYGKRSATLFVEISYVYVDRDVVITGNKTITDGAYEYIYNMNLKTGWNKVFESETSSANKIVSSMTTGNIPSDVQWIISLF